MEDVMNQYCDEIERHRGYFVPSRDKYLEFLFTYMSDMAMIYDIEPQYVTPAMIISLEKALDVTIRCYYQNQLTQFRGVEGEDYEILKMLDVEKGLSKRLFSGLERKIGE